MEVLFNELLRYLPTGYVITLGLLVWILVKVTRTNETIIELSTWRELHEKSDDDRFQQLSDWLNRHGKG